MSVDSPSPGDQLTGLRITAQALPENRAWIPDAIHALIIAALARVFARLEKLFLLWQSGNLPVPAAPQTRQPVASHVAVRGGAAIRASVRLATPPLAARLPSARSPPARRQSARSPSKALPAHLPTAAARPPRSASATRTTRHRQATPPPGSPLVRGRAAAANSFRYRNY